MPNYSLSNAWENARRRLALLEQHLDPITHRRLLGLGLGKGWHCLEIGGGGGSIARWLCAEVGAEGRVVGTDLDPRFLEEIREPNFEAWKHDITIDPLPTGEFDLVHTRWVLQHLADPEPAIERMVAALRPGGWLLVEGMDFFPIHTASSQLYIDLIVALANVIASAGGNDFAGRALPAIVAKQELTDVQAEGDFAILNGGSPMAEFFQLSRAAGPGRHRRFGRGLGCAVRFCYRVTRRSWVLGLWPSWRCREGSKTSLIAAAMLLDSPTPRAWRRRPSTAGAGL